MISIPQHPDQEMAQLAPHLEIPSKPIHHPRAKLLTGFYSSDFKIRPKLSSIFEVLFEKRGLKGLAGDHREAKREWV